MVTYVASATATNTTGSDGISVTVTKPTGTVNGDYMLAVTHGYTGDTTFAAPSGWTLIDAYNEVGGSALRSRAYYKFASSEGASYVWQFQPGAGGGAIGVSISTFRNTVGIENYIVRNLASDPSTLTLLASRTAINYSVATWRDTTSDTGTWTGATEAFDVVAKDAGTIYRGQTGAYSNSVAGGTVVQHSIDMTNSIDYLVYWMFALGDSAPAAESWTSGINVELQINGTWTNVTSDVQYDEGIEVSSGTSSKGNDVEPGTASFTLDNRTGAYSPKYPLSPYYGYLNNGIGCRISKTNGDVGYQTPGNDNYSGIEAQTVSRVKAPSTNALNITGDIDIYLEVEPETWNHSQVLAAKWANWPDSRTDALGVDTLASWVFQLNADSTLSFIWDDGATTGLSGAKHRVSSTAAVPTRLRQYVRATLDVNNGASGNTATFYTSTDGSSWTQLGDAIVSSGTTVINSSRSPLTIGALQPGLSPQGSVYDIDSWNIDINQPQFVINDGFWMPVTRPFVGKIYSLTVKTGIAGTTVASPNFKNQTNGVYNFSDTQSNVWLLEGYGAITNRHYRHHGEITSWPQPRTSEGAYAWVDIESTGILNRIQQGETPDVSALYEYYTAPKGISEVSNVSSRASREPARFPVAYWPIEDETDTEEVSSGLNSDNAGNIFGAVSFGSGDFYVGSKPIANIVTGQSLTFPVRGATPGSWGVEFLLYTPSGMTHNTDIVNIYTSSTSRRFRLAYTDTNQVAAYIYDVNDTLITSQTLVTMNISTQLARVFIFSNGGTTFVAYQIQGSYSVTNTTITLDNATGNSGKVTSVTLTPDQANGVYVGHLAVFDDNGYSPYGLYGLQTGFAPYNDALIGSASEVAARRARRLIGNQSILPYIIGDQGELMGRQYPKSFIDNLRQCQVSDGGFVYEPRNFAGLGYRTLHSMYNATPILALDYAGNQLSGDFKPLIDNKGVVNDATVTKIKGGSGRFVKTTGVNSTASGRYQTNDEASLYVTAQALDQASWRVFIGTNDEIKVDSVTVATENAHYNTGTAAVNNLLTADIGDTITIDNLPDTLTPDQMTQVIIGYSERFDQFTHEITFSTVSGTYLNPGETTPAATSVTQTKTDSAVSTLNSSATTTATSLSVASTGALWTTSGVDFDIIVAGERMTVTSVSGSSSPQTFTVTRSVNGIVKAQLSGATVQLFKPRHAGL